MKTLRYYVCTSGLRGISDLLRCVAVVFHAVDPPFELVDGSRLERHASHLAIVSIRAGLAGRDENGEREWQACQRGDRE